MREIVAMTEHIVGQAKGYESDTIPGDFAHARRRRCPKCGGEVHENYKKFQCQSCDFGFWKIMGGRQLEIAEAEALLRERAVGPLDGFRSKMGRPFSATLKLNDANEVEFDFGDATGDGDDGEAPDFTGQEPLGACPKCGARVFEHGAVLRLRKGRRPREDLRLPLRPHDPAAADRARRRCRSCSPPARPTCCSSCRRARAGRSRRSSCASPTARSASSSRRKDAAARRARGGARRRARCACSARTRDDRRRSSCTPAATAPTSSTASVNATLPDRDQVDTLTLDEALAILAEKIERGGGTAPAKRGAKAKTAKAPGAAKPRAKPATTAAEPEARKAAKPAAGKTTAGAAKKAAKKAAAKRPAARKTTGKAAAKTAAARPTTRKK